MTWGAPLAFLRTNLGQAGQGATSIGRDAYGAAVKAALDAVGIAGKAITVSSVAAKQAAALAKALASATVEKAVATAGAIQHGAGRAKDVLVGGGATAAKVAWPSRPRLQPRDTIRSNNDFQIKMPHFRRSCLAPTSPRNPAQCAPSAFKSATS